MVRELRPIDISDLPELLRLAQEIQASQEGRVPRRAGQDVAVLLLVGKPSVKRPRRKARESAYEYLLTKAGRNVPSATGSHAGRGIFCGEGSCGHKMLILVDYREI